jgi:hypothetical protein
MARRLGARFFVAPSQREVQPSTMSNTDDDRKNVLPNVNIVPSTPAPTSGPKRRSIGAQRLQQQLTQQQQATAEAEARAEAEAAIARMPVERVESTRMMAVYAAYINVVGIDVLRSVRAEMSVSAGIDDATTRAMSWLNPIVGSERWDVTHDKLVAYNEYPGSHRTTDIRDQMLESLSGLVVRGEWDDVLDAFISSIASGLDDAREPDPRVVCVLVDILRVHDASAGNDMAVRMSELLVENGEDDAGDDNVPVELKKKRVDVVEDDENKAPERILKDYVRLALRKSMLQVSELYDDRLVPAIARAVAKADESKPWGDLANANKDDIEMALVLKLIASLFKTRPVGPKLSVLEGAQQCRDRCRDAVCGYIAAVARMLVATSGSHLTYDKDMRYIESFAKTLSQSEKLDERVRKSADDVISVLKSAQRKAVITNRTSGGTAKRVFGK